MTRKEIMDYIQFHKERINELNKRLETSESFDVRKGCVDEMIWRAGEIGKLDTIYKQRLLSKMETFIKGLSL